MAAATGKRPIATAIDAIVRFFITTLSDGVRFNVAPMSLAEKEILHTNEKHRNNNNNNNHINDANV